MDHPSVWMAGRTPAVPPPEGRVDTAPLEVLILGGGLCGLLTAFRLYEKGVRAMAVLEAGEIAGGTSAYCTLACARGWERKGPASTPRRIKAQSGSTPP